MVQHEALLLADRRHEELEKAAMRGRDGRADRKTDADEMDEEEMQIEYEALCDEVAELRAELRARNLEAQQLRLRLQAAARTGKQPFQGAANLPSANSPPAEHPRTGELRGLLVWLAQHAALEHEEVLDVGFEMPICGRKVQLLRVVQWPLPSAFGGGLLLSVPIEHRESVARLLASVRSCNGAMAPETLQSFAAEWDLVAGELVVAQHGQAEPSVLLAHKGCAQGILVARWPTRRALEAQASPAVPPVTPRSWDAPRVGDRVEVEYEGRWYAGTLQTVNGAGKASVKCDADAPGVLTVTALCHVRRAAAAAAAAPQPAKFMGRGDRAQTDEPNWGGASASAAVGAAEAVDGLPAQSFRSRPGKGAGHRRTRSSAL